MAEPISLLNGDCLDLMKAIPDASVDMVMCDPPYGTTACKWDSVIPLEPMWQQLRRIVKRRGAIVLMGSQPFTSVLACSNLKMFRYCWVWDKHKPSGFMYAKYQPMRKHEDILVFYKQAPHYDSQGEKRDKPRVYNLALSASDIYNNGNLNLQSEKKVIATHKKKHSIISVSMVQGDHPTQKPVALMRYLIETYTKPGELVLDFAMGSGTTGVACIESGRRFVGMELDSHYFEMAQRRVAAAAPAGA